MSWCDWFRGGFSVLVLQSHFVTSRAVGGTGSGEPGEASLVVVPAGAGLVATSPGGPLQVEGHVACREGGGQVPQHGGEQREQAADLGDGQGDLTEILGRFGSWTSILQRGVVADRFGVRPYCLLCRAMTGRRVSLPGGAGVPRLPGGAVSSPLGVVGSGAGPQVTVGRSPSRRHAVVNASAQPRFVCDLAGLAGSTACPVCPAGQCGKPSRDAAGAPASTGPESCWSTPSWSVSGWWPDVR